MIDRLAKRAGLTVLALVLGSSTFAGPARTDAHVGEAELFVARVDNFVFPSDFRTAEGRRGPRGAYDLALVRSPDGDELFLQVTDRRSGKGRRIEPEATGRIVGTDHWGAKAGVRLRSEAGQDSLVIQAGGLSASFPLDALRR